MDSGKVAIVAALMACMAGCTDKVAKTDPMDEGGMKAATGYYAEESDEGRIYVFGTAKLHEAYKSSKQKPYIAKTFIGAGPSGKTVVFEADAKSADLQERLRREFNRRHGLNL